MKVDRRELLAGGAATLALAGSRRGADAQAPKPPKAVLKLSSQEGIIPGRDLAERVAKMEKWGFSGIELGGDAGRRIEEVRKVLANHKVKVSALCVGTPGGTLINDDPKVRRSAVDAIKELLTVAGELGSTGVIVVPAFNGQTKLENREARPILIDLLKEIGEHGAKVNGRLLLEPLNRGEAFFLRQLADAGAMCREVNSPGVAMMGDFYHMCIEEPSDMGAFVSAGQWLHHVHLASRTRVMPGQDDRDFTNGFRGLKTIGYQDYCSLECGCKGERDMEIPKAAAFLRDQWAKS
ncbi:MAG: sugar phosphate isomerase/epimerase [Armatimonadetes bacterium]|nr:sugar phosphate isomerase/epimerase [Armatimonadota bacterium]